MSRGGAQPAEEHSVLWPDIYRAIVLLSDALEGLMLLAGFYEAAMRQSVAAVTDPPRSQRAPLPDQSSPKCVAAADCQHR